MKLVEAQEGRRILDRLVGWETSPVLWRVLGRGHRVGGTCAESVAVRMVVQRERARMRFRSGQWNDLEADLLARDQQFRARWLISTAGVWPRAATSMPTRVRSRPTVTSCCSTPTPTLRWPAVSVDPSFVVTSVEKDPFTERPRAPFTTSTLQQESSRKLRLGGGTMSIAQRLYDRGYITYMRTDSTNLSEQAVSAARTAISEQYGDEYLPAEPWAYRSKVKNAQEAHEAIRPAGDRIRTPDQLRALDADEQRLYELVWIRRSRARCPTRAQQDDAAHRGNVHRERFATFRTWARPRLPRLRGAVYVEESSRARSRRTRRASRPWSRARTSRVPISSPCHTRRNRRRVTPRRAWSRGRGTRHRPSVHLRRSDRDDPGAWLRVAQGHRPLVPNWTAFGVTNLLEQHFGHLVDYGFTATMEEALDVVARGEGEAEKWLHTFYFGNGQPGLQQLVSEEQLAKVDPRGVSTIPIGKDDTGHDLVVRVGRYGPYVQRGESETASLPPDIAPELHHRGCARPDREAGGGAGLVGLRSHDGARGRRGHRPVRALRAAR